ncbi:M1 family aminopeptidase [Flavobacterium sp. GT3R68]|uniref:M1 family aminopeptidase n=1 Tax=Flavobacterium sp. GT3R68 TaxID=2594437 RepID=UPI00210572EF|nr:M1 family aminopeptidase [Flavobacterium sp. GT3R68]
MFRKLITFEWHYHTKNVLFYVTFLVFLLLGFFAASGNNAMPGMDRNSPYMITYLVGILSLGIIFSMTLLVAQTLLRDSENKMDVIIYATPVSKTNYLGSQFLSVFGIGVLSFGMAIIGMMIGHHMPWLKNEAMADFSLTTYLWPFLILAIPNILLCTTILTALAWLTRNKLIVYVGGLLIYILYIVGSVFSNSPLLAGASPASGAAMAMVAKMDSFGLAAFFEQTRYWTSFRRNTHGIELTGNLLFNRVLWFLISILILGLSYSIFSFRKINSKKVKKEKNIAKHSLKVLPYRSIHAEIQTRKHNLSVFFSFVKIDIVSVVKGIPFLLILMILSGLIVIEIINAFDGGTRMPESITNTSLMMTTIMEILPFVTILVLLFYSNELIWRSANTNFEMLENATPSNSYSIFFSKLLSLTTIPLLLISASILIGIAFQIVKDNAPIEIGHYLSLFYFIGVPMFLISTILLAMQTFISNKYIGLAVSAVIVFLFSSSFGKLLGINHPLFRFADVLKVPYFDMNGFGNYTVAFHLKILYNLGLVMILIVFSGILWKKDSLQLKKMNFSQKGFLSLGALFFIGFGGYIFYKTNIEFPYTTKSDIMDWKQAYETRFRKYEKLAQPTVIKVKTNIDLYPEEQRYTVRGMYQLINTTGKNIDSLLIYVNENPKLTSVSIPNAKLLQQELEYCHYWYKMEQPFRTNDTIQMDFSMESSWSEFKGHTPFNSIIDNGSFIRISNYFPRFGYQSSNEIDNEKERLERNLKTPTTIPKFEDRIPGPYPHEFIDLDATVSTSGNQTAIGSGTLVKQWKTNDRNYFHYKTEKPIPFRFAFSSAKYQVKKEVYKGISIEVYYDARHHRNVNELIRDTKKTLDYCDKNFGKYPYAVIRYAEISAFAEGFSGTAYPTTIYMKENGGFYGDCSNGNKEDAINMTAGHELSHQWWGSSQFNPEVKEGGWILTETLAQYTELMLYEKAHGRERMLETVSIHLDQYLSYRAFSEERPLYKTNYDTPHLPYNKGMVVMHELRMLIGEGRVNHVLKSLIVNYGYPKSPADSQDFLNEIYKVAPIESHDKIDELFKQIITYSSKVESVSSKLIPDIGYEIRFKASSFKFSENGKGKTKLIPNDHTIDIGIYDDNAVLTLHTFVLKNNHVTGKITVSGKPVKIVVDPYLKNIDSFREDNEKEIF